MCRCFYATNENRSVEKVIRNSDFSERDEFVRRKAIELLGEETFNKVYEYLSKQRRAQLMDDRIEKDLRTMTKANAPTFLVDQLVFLELIESMK